MEKPKFRPDFATIGGLILAASGILGGLLLEGGAIRDVLQYTAAIIVIGGTFGAVMINFPLPVVIGGLKRFGHIFHDGSADLQQLVDQIVELAGKARKQGIVSLEGDMNETAEPFLKKALGLAVDGTDLQELRRMLELQIDQDEHHANQEAKVWESAGGYSPTIGIIGAVMGLIQVMKNLANIEEVGHGIAVAFVATVYGVAFSNILFLPASAKIKSRIQNEVQRKELILEGVSAMVEGLNPKLIHVKLEAYLSGHAGHGPAAKPAGGGA